MQRTAILDLFFEAKLHLETILTCLKEALRFRKEPPSTMFGAGWHGPMQFEIGVCAKNTHTHTQAPLHPRVVPSRVKVLQLSAAATAHDRSLGFLVR